MLMFLAMYFLLHVFILFSCTFFSSDKTWVLQFVKHKVLNCHKDRKKHSNFQMQLNYFYSTIYASSKKAVSSKYMRYFLFKKSLSIFLMNWKYCSVVEITAKLGETSFPRYISLSKKHNKKLLLQYKLSLSFSLTMFIKYYLILCHFVILNACKNVGSIAYA